MEVSARIISKYLIKLPQILRFEGNKVYRKVSTQITFSDRSQRTFQSENSWLIVGLGKVGMSVNEVFYVPDVRDIFPYYGGQVQAFVIS